MTGSAFPSGEEAAEKETEGGPRARRMADRVLRTAVDAGVSVTGLHLLARAHRTAMRFREGGEDGLPGLSSEQHPAYLHPGRTALILMEDLGETDGRVLAVGAMTESRDLEVRVRPTVAGRVLAIEAEAYGWWESLPRPDWAPSEDAAPSDDDLLERLVTAPAPVQRIALAEALDHLRHAHLWTSRAERVRAVELARDVFGPVAPRVHPTLERRLSWWIRRVAPGLAASDE